VILEKIYESGAFRFKKSFDNWETAIRASVATLSGIGAVKDEYADQIIKNVQEYGPYIVITPDACIPHANDRSNVVKTAIGLLKCDVPVLFDPDDADMAPWAFFCLAAVDEEEHLQNLKSLMDLFDNEGEMDRLKEIHSEEEFREYIQK
jgi:PTS system ascorbate-specific IIA component